LQAQPGRRSKAKQVLEHEFSCYPIFSKNAEAQMEKMIESAKSLLKEKPLTIDEKVSALVSLGQKPKAGQVLYWPNEEGFSVPMDPLGGSRKHHAQLALERAWDCDSRTL
jgi:hypothetical protein